MEEGKKSKTRSQGKQGKKGSGPREWQGLAPLAKRAIAERSGPSHTWRKRLRMKPTRRSSLVGNHEDEASSSKQRKKAHREANQPEGSSRLVTTETRSSAGGLLTDKTMEKNAGNLARSAQQKSAPTASERKKRQHKHSDKKTKRQRVR